MAREGWELLNKQQDHHHKNPDKESHPHGFHRPYWKHAHYDWRLWVAASLMLIAILTYVMSDDLAFRPRRSQPISDAVAT
jgi:hypothetical protein